MTTRMSPLTDLVATAAQPLVGATTDYDALRDLIGDAGNYFAYRAKLNRLEFK